MNIRLFRVLPIAGFVTFLCTSGCGKDTSEKARFNESLGGQGPVSVSGIDMGILEDPSGYKPAASGGGGGPAATTGNDAKAPTDASAGGEADEAKSVVSGVVDSLFSYQATGLLDYFDPTQVGALKEVDFEGDLQKVFDATRQVMAALKEKSPESQKGLMDEMPAKLQAAFKDNLTVAILDAENATFTINQENFTKAVTEMAKEAAAKSGQPIPEGQEGAIGLPVAAGPDRPLPMKKVDGKWRLHIPGLSISKEVAEHLKQGCTITHEFLSQVSGKIDTVPAGDEQAMQGAMMQLMPQAMAQFGPWFTELQRIIEDSAGSGAKKPEGDKDARPEGDAPPVNNRVEQP